MADARASVSINQAWSFLAEREGVDPAARRLLGQRDRLAVMGATVQQISDLDNRATRLARGSEWKRPGINFPNGVTWFHFEGHETESAAVWQFDFAIDVPVEVRPILEAHILRPEYGPAFQLPPFPPMRQWPASRILLMGG
jgi:hypothetical protein